MRYGTKDRANVADMKDFARMVKLARASAKTERERMIAEHMPLVAHVVRMFVRKYLGRRLIRDEDIQVGMLGLLAAVNGHNPERGAKFSTYAFNVIRNELLKANMTKAGKLKTTPMGDLYRMYRDSVIAPGEPVGAELMRCDLVQTALEAMTPKSRRMVELRFMEDMQFHEVGAAVGRTKQAAQFGVKRGLRDARQRLCKN